ncbi:hypothetical protein NEIMUCOT_05661 [Neisseria mucosa ATCC 25996]|uniref:Uncharacterized protein n=1 Tax=Neisseria mucosa (strain ATCC 25996 / DSM 4631 / NCTC 10774 / M26) TaxID=546266 RepID=D2ZYF3_NEIM2|nr:hypothetical protein NEIMUCOT_05661 [Neisseria mucosa ATCC 25996]
MCIAGKLCTNQNRISKLSTSANKANSGLSASKISIQLIELNKELKLYTSKSAAQYNHLFII